jgi:hypothetical protein
MSLEGDIPDDVSERYRGGTGESSFYRELISAI